MNSLSHTLAQSQLKSLGYSDTEDIYLRFFYPSTDPRKEGDAGRKLKGLDWAKIEALQKDGRGCYFVVNGQGDTDAAIATGKAIFYEHDNLPKDVQLALWQGFGLPEPTIQIDTGGKSIHSYWVFEAPIPIAEWRELQKDLLEFAEADRSIKNPSRVMRLVGCINPATGALVEIITQSDRRYTYQELRDLIPAASKVDVPPVPLKRASRGTDILPLESCLARKHRALIEQGEGQGNRDSAGIGLAKDLIGTANYLLGIGQPFEGDPYSLLSEYCSHCNPPLSSKDCDRLFKSAQKGDPQPCLSTDKIENCIRVQKKGRGERPQSKIKEENFMHNAQPEADCSIDPAPLREAIEAQHEAEADFAELNDQYAQLKRKQLDGTDPAATEQALAMIKIDLELARQNRAASREIAKTERSKVHQMRGLERIRRLQAADKDKKETAWEKDYNVINGFFGDRLVFNRLTQKIEFEGKVLELEHALVELTELTGHTAWNKSDAAAQSITAGLAKKRSYCPIQDYLLDVAKQNPDADTSSLEDLIGDLFSLSPESDEISFEGIKAFLIGAVNRAFEPGCSYPTMPIFYTPNQGRGKSEILRAIVGKEFFGEGQPDIGSTDGKLEINQSWVYEIAECDDLFAIKSVSKLKAFITQQTDSYRAPYALNSKKHLRRTILVGTTNRNDFLIDESGNRRFLVIPLPDSFELKLEFIESVRDYLWASAYAAYKAGEPCTIPKRLWEAAEARAKDYVGGDPWQETIESRGAEKHSYLTTSVAYDWIGIDPKDRTLATDRRIIRIFKLLGFCKKTRERIEGQRKYRYYRD